MKFKTLLLLLLFQSCATYNQTNFTFNQEFDSGDLDKALETLHKHASEANGRREFLYDANNGLVLSLLAHYDESNDAFEKAFLFGEDYRVNYLNEAASYLTNPNVTSYKGEDHEHLLLLYYKALNYLKLNKTDDALVECRRLNTRLEQLSDRYSSNNKYRKDAFVNVLMGIIYESAGDFNNAFIAYRNGYQIYTDSYPGLFDVNAPQQLKEDLLRTAYLSGLTDELETYKTAFGRADYHYEKPSGGELVFFWHNGLSPVKVEWGVNFAVSGEGTSVAFNNPELGFNYRFSTEPYTDNERNALRTLDVFRIAFPKYVERPLYFDRATIEVEGMTTPLQLGEDVNKIAFKCLSERMTHEFSKALIRVALKKVTEYEVKKQDRTLGAVVGMINAMTEKADIRNWQTLPHSIYYCRVQLPEGKNTVNLRLSNARGGTSNHDVSCDIKKGQITFQTFSSLESGYPNYGYN